MKTKHIAIGFTNILLAVFIFIWFSFNLAFAINRGQIYKADAEILRPVFWVIIGISLAVIYALEKFLYKKSRLTLKTYLFTQAVSPLAGLLAAIISVMGSF